MINFKWENHNFYTIKDLLDEKDVIQIKKDVVRECLDNYIEGYPKFQSYPIFTLNIKQPVGKI